MVELDILQVLLRFSKTTNMTGHHPVLKRCQINQSIGIFRDRIGHAALCFNNQLPGWTINDDHTYSMVLWRTTNHYLCARIANQRKYGNLVIHDGFMIVGVHDHLSQKRKNQFTEAFQWIADIYDIFMQFPRRGQNRIRLKCLTS